MWDKLETPMADEQEIDWAPPDGRLIDLPAGACFVRVSGRDDPAIVLLHGIANDSRVYGRLQPALAMAHRTIAPDFFGWGFRIRKMVCRLDSIRSIGLWINSSTLWNLSVWLLSRRACLVLRRSDGLHPLPIEHMR